MSMRSKILRPAQQMRTAFSSRLRAQLWLLEGREKSSGEPLSVVYAGDSERHQFHFGKLAFDEGWTRRNLGREWLWRVPSRVKRTEPSCALILYDIVDRKKIPIWGSRLLQSPIWVRLALNVDASRPLTGHRIREAGRQIRKYGLSVSSSREEADFDDFYHNMYVPNIQKRHVDVGEIQEYGVLRKKFMSGDELVQINQNSRTIAAGLWKHSGLKSRFHSMGVRDGDISFLKMGVVGVLYYFVLKTIHQRGGGVVDLGGCRSFFCDGVFQYKLEFGARAAGCHEKAAGCLCFQFLRRTDGINSFLRDNPFIAWEGQRKYRGIVFMDKAPRVGDLDDALDRKKCFGINDITVYTFDGSEAKETKTARGRRVRVVSASSVLPGS